MAEGKFVSYLRVSTARQGKSGLGLEAQRNSVEDFLNGGSWQLIKEFVEVESGKNADRPQLEKAFQLCRLTGAKLVIAKLDRLSRDAHFLLGLEKAGVDFVAADMPHANKLTIGIMAVMAQHEREMISERTKAALAAAKRRGVTLGGFRGARFTAKHVKLAVAARQEKARARASDLAPIKSYRRPVVSPCGRLQRASRSGAFLRRAGENGPPSRSPDCWRPLPSLSAPSRSREKS